MIQLVYVSSAATPFTASDLKDILAKSREKNARLGVTGLLLYKDGNILQVLEGEEELVMKLFTTISADERHCGVIRLYTKTIEGRDFPDWTMGFKDISGAEDLIEGVNSVLDRNFDMRTLGASQAAKLVSVFRASIR